MNFRPFFAAVDSNTTTILQNYRLLGPNLRPALCRLFLCSQKYLLIVPIFRLWLMDYTGECVQRTLEEFDYFYAAQQRGIKIRVKLVEAFFREVLTKNATSPSEPPMDYKGMKNVVKTLLYAQGLAAVPISDHQHYLNTQGGAYSGGFDVYVEQTVPGGGDRGRGSGRGGRQPWGGPPAVPPFRTPNVAGFPMEKVGRYPRDFKLGKKADGTKICMAFQQKRCTRVVDQVTKTCKMGPHTFSHVCACILAIDAGGMKLCEGNHCWEDCNKKQ